MTDSSYLEHLNWRLTPSLQTFIGKAAEEASRQGVGLYLVGGAVRDLLLQRPNLDLDLVVEGDALLLAQGLAKSLGGQIITHGRFGTAKYKHNGISIDFATARLETYPRPGQLPKVQPGTLEQDLHRRDFSINAMALKLNPPRQGELVDPLRGTEDLKRGLIRVLHEGSFKDDATRVLRALRYEQRFSFRLESQTEGYLRRDLLYLHTVGGDRLRHELERILDEVQPELVLERSKELGVLPAIYAPLKWAQWHKERFQALRSCRFRGISHYFALLCYTLTSQEAEGFIQLLRLPKVVAQVIHDTLALRDHQARLESSSLTSSQTYHLLKGFVSSAIQTYVLATPSSFSRQRAQLYLDKLRLVRPALDGRAIIALGAPQGPLVGQLIGELRDARLDGNLSTASQEKAWVVKRLKDLFQA